MNPFSNKQLNALRAVRLSQTEKEQLLSTIKSEMAQTPLATATGVRKVSDKRYHVRRPHITNLFTKKIMPIALLIALLMGGTVSYAAEGTLPGDTLYPVKIHVNENVRSAAAISPSAQAELEISLAERRLSEAEALHGKGRLDASTKSELRGRFDEHSGRAKTEIESYSAEDSEGAARIRTDLKVKLSKHGDMLRVLEIEFEDEDGDDRHESQGDSDDGSSVVSGVTISGRSDERKGEQEIERHSTRDEDGDDDRDSEDGDDDEDEDMDDDEWDDDANVGVTSSLGITIPTVITKPAPSPTPAATPSPSTATKTFTLAEVATHSNAQSCYTAVSGSVYDVTSYIPIHKGGMAAILGICGKDGTIFFSAQHAGQPKPETMLASFKIGTLVQ